MLELQQLEGQEGSEGAGVPEAWEEEAREATPGLTEVQVRPEGPGRTAGRAGTRRAQAKGEQEVRPKAAQSTTREAASP